MKLKIEIDLENDAFQVGYTGRESARLLREWCDSIAWHNFSTDESWSLVDANGNTVGKAEVVEN